MQKIFTKQAEFYDYGSLMWNEFYDENGGLFKFSKKYFQMLYYYWVILVIFFLILLKLNQKWEFSC